MFDEMINKVIEAVVLSDDKERITFSFKDGYEKSFSVEGDCCSHSWIEHLEVPNDVVGATLLSVEDMGSETVDDPDHECLQVYQTLFKTDRGTISLEFRNSSNGYYGGYLVASL